MIKHHQPMRWRVLAFGVAFVLGSCTERNKKFCGDDGVCADPAFPFCDVGGEVGGTPDTCIAVQCQPGAVEACREDSAITCNGAGGDFDLIPCAHGCDNALGGCLQCSIDPDCPDTAPVCEGNSCRGCVLDDDCASRVCDRETGKCVLENAVVYASSDATSTACTLVEPCRLSGALQGAVAAGGLPIVRMLPGAFSDAIDLRSPTAKPVTIVGTGATISPTFANIPAITIRDGANVDVRGLTITAEKAVSCGIATGQQPALLLREVSINALGNGSVIDTTRCQLRIASAEMALNANEIVLNVNASSDIKGDRIRMRGNTQHHIFVDGASGTNSNIEITNSLLDNIGVTVMTSGTSLVTLASSTLVHRQFPLALCDNSNASRTVRVENSIVAVVDGAFDAVRSGCTFSNTMLSRQQTPPPGTTVADPRFVDVALSDFHLSMASPAVDAAVPSVFVIEPSVDLDGVARPQGQRGDVGAYEVAQP
jgi:hypothetical protein